LNESHTQDFRRRRKVSDSFNHRLLRYDAPIGGAASIVLGQANFASGS